MPRARLKNVLTRIEPNSFLATCADEFVNFHAEALRHFAHKFVKPDLVDDLVNSVWVSVLEHLETVTALPVERQRAWLLVTVRNRAHDWLRNQRRRRETSLECHNGAIDELIASDGEPVDQVHFHFMRAVTRTALEEIRSQLGERDYRILLAQHFEGRLQGEIAAEVGLSETQVRHHAAHAYQRLRGRVTAYLGPLVYQPVGILTRSVSEGSVPSASLAHASG